MNIARLRSLVATAEENDQDVAPATTIHAIPWSKRLAQFAHTTADTMTIAEVAETNPIEPHPHSRTRGRITQTQQPLSEWIVTVFCKILKEFDHRIVCHEGIVAQKLHFANYAETEVARDQPRFSPIL